MTENHCEICKIECTLKCSLCKTVYYCTQEHQKKDWKSHRLVCTRIPAQIPTSPMPIVCVEGMSAEMVDYPVPDNWSGWEQCPVPTLVGIPLMIKGNIRDFGPQGMPSNQIAVFMMVDPVTSFAPPRWQLGRNCNRGVIGLARKDYQKFSTQDFYDLYDFIYELMDVYNDAPETVQSKLNPQYYRRFVKSRKLEIANSEPLIFPGEYTS